MKCPIKKHCKNRHGEVCDRCLHSTMHGSKVDFINHYSPEPDNYIERDVVVYNQAGLDEFADGLEG